MLWLVCAATVAPPDAEDVLVKWTGLGYDEASSRKVVRRAGGVCG